MGSLQGGSLGSVVVEKGSERHRPGEAGTYREVTATSRASVSDVEVCDGPAEARDVAWSWGKEALKLAYSSSGGFCELFLRSSLATLQVCSECAHFPQPCDAVRSQKGAAHRGRAPLATYRFRNISGNDVGDTSRPRASSTMLRTVERLQVGGGGGARCE
jgi:hypothetical protein